MASNILVIEKDLLNSQAFRGLSSTAKDVYFKFLMKRVIAKTKPRPGRKSQMVITNNGELEYTYTEAEKAGIPRATFMRCIDQLVARGFIDVCHSGSGGKKGDKSLYAISNRWRAWGKAEFVERKRQKDARKGRGFSTYWKKKSVIMGIKNDNRTVIKNDNRKPILKSMVYQK